MLLTAGVELFLYDSLEALLDGIQAFLTEQVREAVNSCFRDTVFWAYFVHCLLGIVPVGLVTNPVM